VKACKGSLPRIMGALREGAAVLTGEKPEVNAEVAARLRDLGHEDFVSYVVWVCERPPGRVLEYPPGRLPQLHARASCCARHRFTHGSVAS
jgi:hypothetical protein